jgi:hypothetical protein
LPPPRAGNPLAGVTPAAPVRLTGDTIVRSGAVITPTVNVFRTVLPAVFVASVSVLNRGRDTVRLDMSGPECDVWLWLYSAADRNPASRVVPPPDPPSNIYDACLAVLERVALAPGAVQTFGMKPPRLDLGEFPGRPPPPGGRYYVSVLFGIGPRPIELPVGDVVLTK